VGKVHRQLTIALNHRRDISSLSVKAPIWGIVKVDALKILTVCPAFFVARELFSKRFLAVLDSVHTAPATALILK
jgi:hypothetical protein